MPGELENPEPRIFAVKERKTYDPLVVSAESVFESIRDINDPEHPLTLEQLNVVEEENISVSDGKHRNKSVQVDTDRRRVHVCFTPTIPHCSMSTLIGLSIRTRLDRTLPQQYKCTVCYSYCACMRHVQVRITPGSHNTEDAINKQLADKERVCAALENPYLLDVVNKCLEVPSG
jgi:metal-sulfur cluster biosynthetic enzyme